MRNKINFLAVGAFLLFWAPQNPCNAAVVIIENLIQADFQFEATAAGEVVFGALGVQQGDVYDLRAVGTMTFSLDDDGTSTTVPFLDAVGQLNGVTPPTPAGFLPFYITPVSFVGGSLSNISRDGNGRIVSGTVDGLAMPWEMIGTGANDGLVLYGDQATTPLVFDGDIQLNYDSGSPQLVNGSTITGTPDFNIYVHVNGDRANRLPGTDPLVFVGRNRSLTAVPEPNGWLFCATAFVFAASRRRLRMSGQLPTNTR